MENGVNSATRRLEFEVSNGTIECNTPAPQVDEASATPATAPRPVLSELRTPSGTSELSRKSELGQLASTLQQRMRTTGAAVTEGEEILADAEDRLRRLLRDVCCLAAIEVAPGDDVPAVDLVVGQIQRKTALHDAYQRLLSEHTPNDEELRRVNKRLLDLRMRRQTLSEQISGHSRQILSTPPIVRKEGALWIGGGWKDAEDGLEGHRQFDEYLLCAHQNALTAFRSAADALSHIELRRSELPKPDGTDCDTKTVRLSLEAAVGREAVERKAVIGEWLHGCCSIAVQMKEGAVSIRERLPTVRHTAEELSSLLGVKAEKEKLALTLREQTAQLAVEVKSLETLFAEQEAAINASQIDDNVPVPTEAELESLKAQVHALSAEIALRPMRSDSRVATPTSTPNGGKSRLGSAQRSIDDLYHTIDQLEGQIVHLSAEIASTQQQQRLYSQFNDLEVYQRLQREVDLLQQDAIDPLRREITTLKQKRDNLMPGSREREAARAALVAEAEACRAELDEKRKEKYAIEDDIQQLEAQRAAYLRRKEDHLAAKRRYNAEASRPGFKSMKDIDTSYEVVHGSPVAKLRYTTEENQGNSFTRNSKPSQRTAAMRLIQGTVSATAWVATRAFSVFSRKRRD